MQSKNSQDRTMGNPQERLHFKIGYILGLVDGEGCYQLENDGKGHLYPSLVISNTNHDIILCAWKYLNDLGVEGWIWKPKLHGKEKRQCMRIYVKGLRKMQTYLNIFTKYPHAKIFQANVLKEYCELRLSVPRKKLYTNGKHDYTRELELKKELSSLNSRNKGVVMTAYNESAKSPETIRSEPLQG